MLSVASAGAVCVILGMAQTASAKLNIAPLFKDIASYTTTISTNKDSADIYFPKETNLKSDKYSFPIVLLLPGANVDKANYSNFARIVASYGFVVVVPNHQRSLPQFRVTGLLAETSQVKAVLTQMVAENSNPASPIAGVVNTRKLALVGHSHGGAVGLSAIANICQPILCEGEYNRPDELVAGAFFGANLRDQNTQKFISINNSGIPIALLQGNVDSIAIPTRAKATYAQIQASPKVLIDILGANHYGITNTNNPNGPIPDKNTPKIAQDVAVETVGRWSGLFLRASVLDDKDAFDYVYSKGDALDKNVSVTSQAKPVPKTVSELFFTLGLVMLSACGGGLQLKKRQQ